MAHSIIPLKLDKRGPSIILPIGLAFILGSGAVWIPGLLASLIEMNPVIAQTAWAAGAVIAIGFLWIYCLWLQSTRWAVAESKLTTVAPKDDLAEQLTAALDELEWISKRVTSIAFFLGVFGFVSAYAWWRSVAEPAAPDEWIEILVSEPIVLGAAVPAPLSVLAAWRARRVCRRGAVLRDMVRAFAETLHAILRSTRGG